MNNLTKISSLVLIGTFLLLTAVWAGQTSAKEPGETAPIAAHSIRLQSRTFSPQPGIDPSIAARISNGAAGPQHLLIQLHAVPTESERDALAEAGIELLGYIPDNAWLASVRVPVDLRAQEYGLVRWIGALLPEGGIGH